MKYKSFKMMNLVKSELLKKIMKFGLLPLMFPKFWDTKMEDAI